jgi:cytidyltransferase-like protein
MKSAMMLGRYQPFHNGHKELFKKSLEKTGHVTIMVRDCNDENNPFNFKQIKDRIENSLNEYHGKFLVMQVPNITNICYGRDVGYKIEEIILPEEIQKISATDIRNKMKND